LGATAPKGTLILWEACGLAFGSIPDSQSLREFVSLPLIDTATASVRADLMTDTVLKCVITDDVGTALAFDKATYQ
jgi:hypothetical protein